MSNNTATSFHDKWKNNPNLAFNETLDPDSEIRNWIITRNGFDSDKSFSAFLQGKKRILDAGCGNGRVTALLRSLADPASEITGIDLVAADIARANFEGVEHTRFYSKNLLGDLSDLGKFDFIYCQEVLHHTDDPFASFKNLTGILEPGGEIAIYVYRKKAPLREFADDYIRDRIAGLDYEAAMKVCDEITNFGKQLSESGQKVKVPALDILGIEAGEYDLQRFVYHFFFKCFWNSSFSFHDNSVINYDWYHPQNCTRHTLDEIEGWFKDCGVEINWKHQDFYGITVRGKMPVK